MAFLTNEKLVIVGAAGMIGSNMVQSALMMGLTSNICLYDVFSPEVWQKKCVSAVSTTAKITATTDVAEAFKDAKYIISLRRCTPQGRHDARRSPRRQLQDRRRTR